MPVSIHDIDREIERREALASIEAEIDRRSRDSWPEFRGAAQQLIELADDTSARPRELMISGPAETGKTFACLWFLDQQMRRYPGSQGAICRKLRSVMDGSVLGTWQRVIAIRGGVSTYGGNKPEFYEYSNGSRVWVAGLDKPGNALSSERNFVYVNQAEELNRDDWQTLTTRTTGRGGFSSEWAMLYGDCNPGAPTHWIVNRPTLKRFESRHEDNPSLFTADGQITAQGRLTMETLDALEGVLKERLRYGRWVVAEGAVYALDRRTHVITEMPAGWEQWRKIRAIDFGFTNPFVCLWGAVDPDGRLYIYRQLYMSNRTVDQHAKHIQRIEHWYKLVEEAQADLAQLPPGQREQETLWFAPDEQNVWMLDLRRERQPIPSPRRERVETSVADHDAGDRATLAANRIITVPARKDISVGIQAVQKRLRLAGDKQPRLYILEDCLVERDETLATKYQPLSLEQEMDVYSWPKGVDGKPVKEVPIDLYNHACDALRYLVMHVDRVGQSLIR